MGPTPSSFSCIMIVVKGSLNCLIIGSGGNDIPFSLKKNKLSNKKIKEGHGIQLDECRIYQNIVS